MHDDERHPRGSGPDEPPVDCATCGTPADDELAVLTWMLDVSDTGWTWICPACSRDHVRDIEARLDPSWW